MSPPIQRRRRAVAVAVGLVVAMFASACLPAAPPVRPPTTAAPAGTWRASAEAWVTQIAPALVGRHSTQVPAWADKLVRGSAPIAVAHELASTLTGTRHAVDRTAIRLGTPLGETEASSWVSRLRSGTSEDTLVATTLGDPTVVALAGDDASWVDLIHDRLLGRPADPSERAEALDRLGRGESHPSVVLSLLRSAEGRRATVQAVAAELGLPTGAPPQRFVDELHFTAGSTRYLRASMTVHSTPAPAPLRIGVAGSSVGFELSFRWGGAPIGPVAGPIAGAGRIGCGVGAGVRWQYPAPGGGWRLAAGGDCHLAIASELTMASRSDVVVWDVGSWETSAVRIGSTVVPAQSAEMRRRLAAEMVRRIDTWTARGVRAVVLPGWCVGIESSAARRSSAYRTWLHSVFAEVRRQRPSVVSVAPVTPQMCDGNLPTADMNSIRRGGDHWPTPEAVRWAFRYQLAPAIADARVNP